MVIPFKTKRGFAHKDRPVFVFARTQSRDVHFGCQVDSLQQMEEEEIEESRALRMFRSPSRSSGYGLLQELDRRFWFPFFSTYRSGKLKPFWGYQLLTTAIECAVVSKLRFSFLPAQVT